MGIRGRVRSWARFGLRMLLGPGTLLAALATDEVDLLRGPLLRLRLENDLVVGTDRHYTHGSQVVWLQGEAPVGVDPEPAPGRGGHGLPTWGLSPQVTRWGLTVGQGIYTPANISVASRLPDDRPYAGFLQGGVLRQVRGASAGVPAMDQWGVELGLTGPSALGEVTQNAIHTRKALGWQNQLDTTVGLGLRYARTWRWRRAVGDWATDVLPHLGGTLGYFRSDLRAGLQWRFGHDLPADFGARTIGEVAAEGGGSANEGRPRSELAIHGLLGLEGRLVGHDGLVSGPPWTTPSGVDPRRWGVDLRAGMVVGWGAWEVAMIQTVRSPEFIGQGGWDSFGSVTLGRGF